MVNLIVPDSAAKKPRITTPGAYTATYKVGTTAAIPKLSIISQDTGTITVKITRKTGKGTVNGTNPFSGTYSWVDPTLTITGTKDALATFLAGKVTYTPNATDSGEILFTVDVTDQYGSATLCLKNGIKLLPPGVSTSDKAAKAQITIAGTTGTFRVKADGQPIMDWGNYAGTISATASLIANMVNSFTGTPKYTATFDGSNKVTIIAPLQEGKDANGLAITIERQSGDVYITNSGGAAILGGGESKPSALDGWFGKVFTTDNALKILGGTAGGVAGYYLDKLLSPNTGVIDIKLPEVYINETGSNTETKITALYKGKLINIPNNYNGTTRVYTGSWDYATFKKEWTDDPVWIALDYLTDKLHGCGNFVNMNTTQWTELYKDCYAISQYCNGSVSNGKGGTEFRYSTHTAIAKMSKIEALDLLTSVFFGKFLFMPERVVLTADYPQTPSLLVGPANTYEGLDGKDGITLKGGSYGSLYNNVNVTFINPDKYYTMDSSNVKDQQSIDKYGERTIAITAPCCKSEGQALRYAIGYMENEKKDPLTATWKGYADHFLIRPGQTVRVMPRCDFGTNSSFGRLVSFSSNSVVVDRDITISGTPNFYINTPTGVASYTVVSYNPSTRTVTLSGTVSTMPNACWMLGDGRSMRILTKNENNLFEFTLTAYQYDPTKFSRIDTTPPIGLGTSPV